LCDISSAQFLNRQTTLNRDGFYEFCRDNNRVPASVGKKLTTPYDHRIKKVGGGVLSPKLTRDIGIDILQESASKTSLSKWVLDADAVSFYPTLLTACNTFKETKLSTVLEIKGFNQDEINEFFALAPDAHANGVYLAQKYFGLPGYVNMYKQFMQSRGSQYLDVADFLEKSSVSNSDDSDENIVEESDD
jgi:hypothetical protein